MYFDNKLAVEQDIILHDSISKRAAAFFQLSNGFSILGFLDMLRSFPKFEKYFVHSEAKVVTAEMFLGVLMLPRNPSDEQAQVIAMLCQFIESRHM